MKKLMTIAAVALCTAAVHGENGIQSANIVGYKAEALQEGATMMTACFVPTTNAEEGIDLLDLTVGGEYSSGDVFVQTLTSVGLADKTYVYVRDRSKNWFWEDDDGNKVEEGTVKFAAGKGLWVGGVDASALTSSGAVSTDDITIMLQDGATATGNMTPVELDLTKIVPGGEYSSGDIFVQTLTSIGLADKTYVFVRDRSKNWFWEDDDGNKVEEGTVKFAAGKGLWVGGVEGATITIPGPTL